MSKIDFELKDRIYQLYEDDLITQREAEILTQVFSYPSRKEAAQKLGIEHQSLSACISKLIRDRVLIKVRKGVLKLTDDISAINRQISYAPPPPKEVPLVISDDERKWMLQHYDGRKRSEAAKILGRSKYDINRMALALGLDRKY
ncbi:hypothetical protein FRY98_24690 [Paenibacillus faecis]|uniref:Uncharacterized protein n=1 Tax=Paenibacillus faecis TaxID=862114 RepID=A0A5D0CQE0_9BACL|nr:hypothetical protein [Paenibacillus faecis]TYA10967.1 hypothetical protein FRY98_24690 [Paenibacillus faecis]